MTTQLTEYTFTFDKSEENQFRGIVDRLDENEFVIKQEIKLTDPDDRYNTEMTSVMEMEPIAAATFRFGMKNLKIRRTRNEEELAAEAAEKEKNTIHVHVKVNGLP